MLSVILYNSSKKLRNLSFIDQSKMETIVICPGPQVADEVRGGIDSDIGNLQVITVSKFIKDQLLYYGKGELSVIRKADSLMMLGTIWKKIFESASFETFLQAFTIFTELRSFTLELSLVEEVLSELDSEVSKAVKIFWIYFDDQGIIDEHGSYKLLGDLAKLGQYFNRNLVFWGFNHMSATQVELLKSLGLKSNVYVPFPRPVYEKTSSSDWIRWLSDDYCSSELGEDDSLYFNNLSIVGFSRGRLNSVLSQYIKRKNTQEKLDIFLTVKDPSFNQFNEISIPNSHFKNKNDFFSGFIQEIGILIRNKYLVNNTSVETTFVIDYLNLKLKKELTQEFDCKNLRLIKSYLLMIKSVKSFVDLSDDNNMIDSFDLRNLIYISQLNIPRTYSSPLVKNERSISIKGLESLESFNNGSQTGICVTSDYPSLKGGGANYSQDMIEFLMAIGPIQRSELDFMLTKHKLLEMLSSEKTTLFLEKGIVEKDLAWSDILSSFKNNNYVEIFEDNQLDLKVDHLKQHIKKAYKFNKFSASMIQTFIDCRRKFYFRYIEGMDVYPDVCGIIRYDQIGELEHSIIEKYLDSYFEWSHLKHEHLCHLVFDTFIATNEMKLDKFEYDRVLSELKIYSGNGIRFLTEFRKIDPGATFVFELPIEGLGVGGKIDCIVKTSLGDVIIDFKRSKSGIPTNREFLNFDVIQLWFYLNHVNKNIIMIGYLNLSDIEDSLLHVTSSIYLDKFEVKEFAPYLKIRDCEKFAELLERYVLVENQLKDKINTEKEYNAIPRKARTCSYCSVANICPRKTLK